MKAYLLDGHTLSIEGDVIEVTSFEEPDPNWREIDALGHVHTWDSDTWKHMSEGDGDFYYRSWHECKQCGEKVHPGTRPMSQRQFVAGTPSYRLDGELITKEQAEAMVASEGVGDGKVL